MRHILSKTFYSILWLLVGANRDLKKRRNLWLKTGTMARFQPKLRRIPGPHRRENILEML
jgi:hypothetical protein